MADIDSKFQKFVKESLKYIFLSKLKYLIFIMYKHQQLF